MTGAIATVPSSAPTRSASQTILGLLPYLAGATVFALVARFVDGQPVGALRDDSMYVELAKSLATGHGYRWLNLPGAPAATHFPPGYPAVLAMLWLLAPSFPANIVLFKLANTLFVALAAIGVARYVRHRCGLSEWGAQLFGVAALIAAPMLTLATQVMSEPLFLVLLVWTLLSAERAIDDPDAPWWQLVVLGVFAAATTLVRTNGVALLPAIAAVLCLRRRYRHAALFALTMLVALLPWQLWVAAHANVVPVPMRANYESYLALLFDAVRTQGLAFVGAVAVRTSREIANLFQYAVAPVTVAPVRIAAVIVLAGVASLGARALWRRGPVTALFLAAYCAIVVLWPYTPGRFVWCIWPLVFLLPVLGARELVAWRPRAQVARLTKTAALAAIALLAVGYGAFNLASYRAKPWSSQGYAEYLRPLLVHVASHTAGGAVVATEAENTVYLYTGRKTVPLGSFLATDYVNPRRSSELSDGMAVVIDRYRPDVVVVSAGFLRAAATQLASRVPPTLALVDSFPGGGLVLVPTRR